MTKILKYLLIFMLPLAIAACSKDDDGPKGADAAIVGTWTGYVDFDRCYWSMEFKSKGNFYWKFWDEDDSDYGYYKGTYEYDSEEEELYMLITEDEDEKYRYPEPAYFECSISGKTMTLYDSGDRVILKKK